MGKMYDPELVAFLLWRLDEDEEALQGGEGDMSDRDRYLNRMDVLARVKIIEYVGSVVADLELLLTDPNVTDAEHPERKAHVAGRLQQARADRMEILTLLAATYAGAQGWKADWINPRLPYEELDWGEEDDD